MTFPQVVTPECFSRGSTMLATTLSHVEWIGGPVMVDPMSWFSNSSNNFRATPPKSPLPLFSKEGLKPHRNNSPFEKGGQRGIFLLTWTLTNETEFCP